MSLAGILSRKGAPAVCSHMTAGTYDPLTGVTTGGTTETLSGSAMEIDGDPDLYSALGLIESDNPTLLFRPTTPGTLPDLGWSIAWGGVTLTVKNVTRLAMTGTPTAAKIVVSR